MNRKCAAWKAFHTRAQSYFALLLGEVTGLSRKLPYVLLRTFPPSPIFRLRTRLRRTIPTMEDLSSVAAYAAKEDSVALPSDEGGDRPARLTTGRYVKEQRPAVPRRTPKLYQIAAPGFKRGSWPKRGNWHDMDAVGAGVGGGGAAENHDERLRRTAFRLSFGQILYFHSARFDTSIRLNSEQPSFLRGDRPPGSQPDGMSKIKCPQFPTERCNYTKSPRLGSNAANNSGI